MVQNRILNSVMETRDHLKNEASPKSQMSRRNICCLLLLVMLFSSCTEVVELDSCCEPTNDTYIIDNSRVSLFSLFDSEGDTNEISVSYSDKLTVSTCPDWITFSKTGNTGKQVFHLTAPKNESSIPRTEVLKLVDEKNETKVLIEVEQSGKKD